MLYFDDDQRKRIYEICQIQTRDKTAIINELVRTVMEADGSKKTIVRLEDGDNVNKKTKKKNVVGQVQVLRKNRLLHHIKSVQSNAIIVLVLVVLVVVAVVVVVLVV
jgi:hypothetical protein